MIFEKQIVGNSNSSVAQLIKDLGNSDWVKQGLEYLATDKFSEKEICPFCQEKTISEKLIADIKNYFDTAYTTDINSLESKLKDYVKAKEAIPEISSFKNVPQYDLFESEFELKYKSLINLLEKNIDKIKHKIKTPSIPVSLEKSDYKLVELNEIIKKINQQIIHHNNNIDQKDLVREKTKDLFWQIMRWNYDHIINKYLSDRLTHENKTQVLSKNIVEDKAKIQQRFNIIAEQQKLTINIEEAVANINRGLIDLGIDDFKINKYDDNFYKIVRAESKENVFHSLSEGEKMIISFLYFIERCKGKKSSTDTGKKKIIVIDDPISSLSHIYIFNIGRLIHKV